jgi:hypothetical protein
MRLPEKLPELSGRALAAYKALWWAMLAISLVALTLGQWRSPEATAEGGFGDTGATIALSASTLDALIVLTGAGLLFWRRPGDPVAALLSLGLLAVPANDVAHLVADPVWRTVLDNGLDAVPMVCILLGMTVFPGRRFHPRWTLLIVPAILSWGVFLFIGDELPTASQLAMVLPALVIAVSSLVWRYVRMEPGSSRQQVKWVMLGFAGFFACGMIEFALLFADASVTSEQAHFTFFVAVNLMTPLEGLCIVGGLLVSLLRYRLYDADAAISRSAVYAGLTAALFGIFAASETLLQTLSQKWLGASNGAVGGALAAALAASLLVPLHHRLNDWARKRFQRDLSRLRAKLPEVLIAIRDSSSPAELADDALKLAMRGVHASHGAILLADRRHLAVAHAERIPAEGAVERLASDLPLDAEPGAVRSENPIFPLRLALVAADGQTAGWLALGPHPDGSRYGKEDRKALEELAPPLARALLLAIERSHREKEREAERRSLVERLAQLEQTLAQVVTPRPEAGTA